MRCYVLDVGKYVWTHRICWEKRNFLCSRQGNVIISVEYHSKCIVFDAIQIALISYDYNNAKVLAFKTTTLQVNKERGRIFFTTKQQSKPCHCQSVTLFRGCCCINDAYFYLGASFLIARFAYSFVSPKTFFKTIITAREISSTSVLIFPPTASWGWTTVDRRRRCSIDMLRRWSLSRSVQQPAGSPILSSARQKLRKTKAASASSLQAVTHFTYVHLANGMAWLWLGWTEEENWTLIWDRWEMCCHYMTDVVKSTLCCIQPI